MTDDSASRILEQALARGLLTPEQVATLRAARQSDGPATRAVTPTPPGVPVVRSGSEPGAALADTQVPGSGGQGGGEEVLSLVGRYELTQFLGEGGMGRVWKARDPRLQRHVALKLLRHGEAELVERLVREARAQAQVEHPNVCRVYEVGEDPDLPFIAMQLVVGPSLREVYPRLSVEDKVQVLRQVASAVHAAHRTGLVHRDIKPANVLLERRPDGGWHPYVVDFGLAREQAAPGLTATGAVVGTAPYMAPEQARGDAPRIDRRTDVWGLGVTLYEVLTGRLPFEGDSTIDVLVKALNDDPTPPRRLDPSIPADLERIVLKCLEKEAQHRYQSAREVEEELGRFLDGEPLLARRTHWTYRVVKKARKHRGATAAAAVGFAAILVVAALGIEGRVEARREAAVAQRFLADIERLEALVRRAYSAPPHDIRAEQAQLRQLVGSVRQRLESSGRRAQGPGHYALGRGHLALQEFGAAREHLELAWLAGLRPPEVAYHLGLATGAVYLEALADAQRGATPEARERLRRQAEERFRQPALEYLRASAGATGETGAYVEGLIALVEERYDEALEHVNDALRHAPWLYEARRLEGDVRVAQGRLREAQGQYPQALESYEAAGAAYRAAIEFARSDVALYEADCERWLEVVGVHLRRGASPLEPIHQAIDTCLVARRINPDRAFSYGRTANVYCILADFQRDHGQDPRPALGQAVELAEQALQRSPRDVVASVAVGWALYMLGDLELQTGGDAQPYLDRSVARFKAILRENPTSVEAYNALGYALDRRAKLEMATGRDPTATLHEAVEGYRQALELDPGFAPAYNNTGIALYRQADWERRTGRDPRPTLVAARERLLRALAQNPNYAYACFNLAATYRIEALYLVEQGQPPETAVAEARAAIARGLAVNPDIFWAYSERAESEVIAARGAIAGGSDPAPFFRAAEAALARALGLHALSAETLTSGGRLWLAKAEWEQGTGRPSSSSVRCGLEQCDRALAINPRRGDTLVVKGALLVCRARTERGSTRRATLDAARAALGEAVRLNPSTQREALPWERLCG